MTTLKVLVLALITSAAANSFAQSMNAYLDFSNLYGKTNAGQYFVGVALNPKAEATLEITQSLEQPPSDDQSALPEVCLTEIRLNAGNYTFIMTDAKKNTAVTLTQNMDLYTGFYDETETCTPVETLLAGPLSFNPYFNLGGFDLSYRAPAGYSKITTALYIFPYGYSVSLVPSKNADGSYSVQNLKAQMDSQVKRGNKEGLSYYTFAQQDNSTLSLGNGFVELK